MADQWWKSGARLVESSPGQADSADWWKSGARLVEEVEPQGPSRDEILQQEFDDRLNATDDITLIQNPSDAIRYESTEGEIAAERAQRTQEALRENVPGYDNALVRTPLQGLADAGGSVASLFARVTGGDADAINRQRGELEYAASLEDQNSIVNERVLRAGRGATSSLATLFALRGAGMPAIIAGYSAQAANDAITEGRDAGLSGGKLAAYAASQGIIEGGTTMIMNKLGLGGAEARAVAKQAVGQSLKGAAKQLGKDTLQELAEEELIFLQSSLARYVADVDPDALSMENLASGALDTALSTVMVTSAVNVPSGVRAARDAFMRDPSRKNAEAAGIEANNRAERERIAEQMRDEQPAAPEPTEDATAPQAEPTAEPLAPSELDALATQEAETSPVEAVEQAAVELPPQFAEATDDDLAAFLRTMGVKPIGKGRKNRSEQLRQQVAETLKETGIADAMMRPAEQRTPPHEQFELELEPAATEPAFQPENISTVQPNLPEIRGRGDLPGQRDFTDELSDSAITETAVAVEPEPPTKRETPKQILDRRIREEVGDNPQEQQNFRDAIDYVWELKTEGTRQLLDDYKQVFAGNTSRGRMAQRIRMALLKGRDISKIKGLDLLIDEIATYHPHLLQFDTETASRNDVEAAAMDLIRGGAKQFELPAKHSDAIIEEAKALWERYREDDRQDSSLSKKAKDARQDFFDAVDEMADEFRGKIFSTPFDPELMVAAIRLTAKAIKAGVLTAAEVTQEVSRRMGQRAAKRMQPYINAAWKKLQDGGDEAVDRALRMAVRPKLANPATDPAARSVVEDADAERVARGEPQQRSDETVQAEADSRIKGDYDGERNRLLQTGREGGMLNDTDTVIAKSIINREGVEAIQSGDEQKLRDAIDLVDAYRRTGTEQARGFRQRRDPVESPEQRRERHIVEAILTPPQRDKKKIDKARKDGDNEAAEKIRNQWAEEVKKLRETLKAMGIDPDNISEHVKDPVVAAQALGTIQAAKADRWDAAYEYWRNAILSAWTTQAANLIGNTVHTGWHYTAERFTEALVNTVVRDKDAAQMGEFKYLLAGVLPGLSKGAQNFVRAWKSEIPYFEAELGRNRHTKLEEPNIAISGAKGRFVRAGFYFGGGQRLLLAADEFAKTLIANMEAGARAYRIAKAEGLRGPQLSDRIALLSADTTSVAWDHALDTALELTFQSELGPLGRSVLSFRKNVDFGGFKPVAYLIPFVTTPGNIFKLGIKKSPLGSLKLSYTVYKAAQTGDWSKVPAEAAQQVLAWGLVLALLGNDPEEPWITGAAVETERGPRDLAYRTAPPQSIRIGDKWYNYSRIEPFATVLASTVDMIQAIQQGEGGKGSAFFKSMSGQLENKTFLAGVGDFVEAVKEPSRVPDWASNFATSWVPNIIRSGARATGETIPERGVWGPGPERTTRLLRRTLQKTELGIVPDQPKIDIWGRDIPRDKSPVPKTDWLWRAISPVKMRDGEVFSGDRLLLNWNNSHPGEEKYPMPPLPTYTDRSGKKQSMDDEQYTQFLQLSGRIARSIVTRSNLNADNPTQRDIDILSRAITRGRTTAKRLLIAEWSGGPSASKAVAQSFPDSEAQ